VNRRRHGDIGQARRCGLDIRDQVRPVGVAGFGQMDLVADPANVTLFGVASLWIVRRMKAPAHRRLISRLAPADTVSIMVKLLDPDEPQPLHRLRPIRPEALLLVRQSGQQVVAIRADGFSQRLTRGQALGQTILLDPGAVSLCPV